VHTLNASPLPVKSMSVCRESASGFCIVNSQPVSWIPLTSSHDRQCRGHTTDSVVVAHLERFPCRTFNSESWFRRVGCVVAMVRKRRSLSELQSSDASLLQREIDPSVTWRLTHTWKAQRHVTRRLAQLGVGSTAESSSTAGNLIFPDYLSVFPLSPPNTPKLAASPLETDRQDGDQLDELLRFISSWKVHRAGPVYAVCRRYATHGPAC
jgi:hypothetical protein